MTSAQAAAPQARISEASLWRTLALYQGWAYRSPVEPARYPLPIPGALVRLGPPAVADCCTLVEGLILLAACDGGIIPEWSPELHRRAVASVGLWPTEAYVAAGLADEIVPGALAACGWPRWTVLQGWTRDPGAHPPGPGSTTTGHTMLLVDASRHPEAPADSARCLVLHCGRLPGVPGAGGVGWREIGPLEVGPPVLGPPAGWQARAPTWGSLRRTWPIMRAAALRVG